MGLPALRASALGLLQSKFLFLKEHNCLSNFTPHLREELLKAYTVSSNTIIR